VVSLRKNILNLSTAVSCGVSAPWNGFSIIPAPTPKPNQIQVCVGIKDGFYGGSEDLELVLHSSIVLVAILLIQLSESKGSDA
jgi:hypothetical protein